MPQDVDEPAGRRTRTVRFFDFAQPEPGEGCNEFIVTTQMRVRRGREKVTATAEDDERLVIPDLVLFVNGIPLVVIEAKSPTLIVDGWRALAVRQLRRYQEAGPEWQGSGAPDLFDYNLMCVAIGGPAGAAFGTIGATENEYTAWKWTGNCSNEQCGQIATEPNGQAQLIFGLLAPATLLDVLRDFVVYEPENGRIVKKLPRYQQYRAVVKSMGRILREAKPDQRGGVIWHTQGSGKSLTMLWLATKLRRDSRLQNPTIVIVTDRTQLDTQITRTFERCGFPAPEHAGSTRDLRSRLTTGAGRTISTTIQKFEDALKAPKGDLEALNPAHNVFVMVDEAHRTQYGLLGALMSKALPNATFVGFTGTPIDKDFRRSTMKRFGPLIDAYTIPEAVADGATVPIFYEARLPALEIQGPNTVDRLFEAMFGDQPDEVKSRIKRRYANKETLALADKRIEMIALDIGEHFAKHVRPNGFKAQVVAPSREAATKYWRKLRDFGINAYPIITTTNDDGPEFKEARSVPKDQIIAAFKDVNGKPEILVVVDMLLTGFDAPVEQVMYLDRGLREHGLLQAIARVNRRLTVVRDGVATEKTYGLIVDYWGVSRELEVALSGFEHDEVRDAWRRLDEEPGPIIDAIARQAESHFKGRDLDDFLACAQVFAADASTEGTFKADIFENFSDDYRGFAVLLDRFLPDQRAIPYADRLARLTKIRAFARAQFLRQDSTVDWDGVSAKVKALIDDRISADVLELMKPVSILDQDFEQKIDDLPHEEARASVMEHAIRARITERLAENPAFYEKLSERLEHVIAEMRQHLIDAATAVKHLRQLRLEALSTADLARQQGLSEVSYAVYELLERMTIEGPDATSRDGVRENQEPYLTGLDERLKGVSLSIEKVMGDGQAIVDWQNKEDVQRVMRRDIKRELRQLSNHSEEQLNELAASMVEIARRKHAR